MAPTATAVELELVFEVGVAAAARDLLFEVLDRTGDVEDFDRSTIATDQKVLMVTFPKTVVSSTAVKADASNDSVFLES